MRSCFSGPVACCWMYAQGIVSLADRVYLDGSIAALRRQILIQWVPSDTLYVMGMILYLVNARTVCNREHLREVICTSCDNVLSIGTPSDIVDFLLRYVDSSLVSPVLFITQLLGRFFTKVTRRKIRSYPKDYKAVITSRSQDLAIWTPPNNIDCCCMPLESRKVRNPWRMRCDLLAIWCYICDDVWMDHPDSNILVCACCC